MKYQDILSKIEERPPRGLNDSILLLDGMNTLIRSFALIKSMNPTGSHVGGMVGFLRSLGYVNRILDPTRIIVVWDGKGGSANRKNINPEYKAQRATAKITHWGLYDTKAEEQEALIAQLFRTQDYLECLPIHQIGLEKLEADDIIAYLANRASASGKKVTIVSSDKDFLQLIDDNISVYAPIKKKVFDKNNVEEELKVIPQNYNIIKALTGDSSDNLVGVKGLGIKTIVKEFPQIVSNKEVDLDYIYTVCEQRMQEKKIFPKIIHEWDKVENNFKIMDLHNTTLSDSEIQMVEQALKEPIPNLQTGPFLHLLEQDKIEGITKNTEMWVEGFRPLTTYK